MFKLVHSFVILATLSLCEAAGAVPLGQFVHVRNLGRPVNTGNPETGVDISADGLTLLIYGPDRRGGLGGTDIWIAHRKHISNDFGEPINLGEGVNSRYFDGGPNLSADSLTLYFDSDRPGGIGDLDLYVATRASTAEPFGNVQNLGEPLNSQYRDAGPILSTDELTMYFQSERRGGEGGRDIYLATRASIDEPFGNVVNLGSGVNSRYMDTRGDISADGLNFFFAADLPGGAAEDIYGPKSLGRDLDIYLVSREGLNEPFTDKVLIGPPVSTGTIESGPQITGDWPAAGAKLYFTSWTTDWFVPYRKDGVGRMDVYEATWIPAGFTVQPGDANWDGSFDQHDLAQVMQNAKYLTTKAASWEQGDWNHDGQFDQLDIVIALDSSVYRNDSYGAPIAADELALALPEPSALVPAAIGFIGFLAFGRRWRFRLA